MCLLCLCVLLHAVLQVDPSNLSIQTLLNGEVVQDSNTADMTFSVAEIVSFLSQGMTLAPGTVILTGTPEVRGVRHASMVAVVPSRRLLCLLCEPFVSCVWTGRWLQAGPPSVPEAR